MPELLSRIPAPSPRFRTSWEARACAERLRQAQVGDVVPYGDLATAAGGLDVQHARRYILATARAIVLREDGLVFDAVTNIGLQLLAPEARVALSERPRRRMQGLAKRQLAVLRTVAYADLAAPMQAKGMAYAAMLVAVGSITGTKTLRFIEKYGQFPMVTPPTASHVQGLFR